MSFTLVMLACIKQQPPSKYRSTTRTKALSIRHTHFERHLITNIIEGHAEELAACYKKPRCWQPPAPARIVVDFVIKTEDGTVPLARSKVDTFHLTRNRDCILEVFRRMQFPAGMVTDTASDRYDPGSIEEQGFVVTFPLLFES